jgi:hypothetical protein
VQHLVSRNACERPLFKLYYSIYIFKIYKICIGTCLFYTKCNTILIISDIKYHARVGEDLAHSRCAAGIAEFLWSTGVDDGQSMYYNQRKVCMLLEVRGQSHSQDALTWFDRGDMLGGNT